MMLANKEKCTGCGACQAICPKNCITMQPDNMGFKYPVIDAEKCVGCGACERVCPALDCSDSVKKMCSCYIGVHKDEDILMHSSSGGAFSALVSAFCENAEKSVVCGAVMEDDFNVRHVFVNGDVKSIKQMRQSKYVQSDITEVYKKLKDYVQNGYKVLFAGTPCQCAALRNYLGKEYENLLLVDILCEGVCGVALVKHFVHFLETKRKKEVVNFTMRNKERQKDNSWRVMEHRIEYSDGTTEKNRRLLNIYKQMFCSFELYRDSCYDCSFDSVYRAGDITIGDWWGSVDGLDNEYRGASVICINRDGKIDLNLLKKYMNIKAVPIDEVINQQPTLNGQKKKIKKKVFFGTEYTDFVNLMKSYYKITPQSAMKSIVKFVLPNAFVSKLREMRRK